MDQPIYAEHALVRAESKSSPRFSKKDNIFLFCAIVVSFCFVELVLWGGFGVAIPLFFLVFYPFAIAMLARVRYSRKSENPNKFWKCGRPAILSFVPVILLLVCFAVFDNAVLRFFNIIALWLCVMLNLVLLARGEGRPVYWAGLLPDILYTTFCLPFLGLGKCVAAFTGALGSKKRKNTLTVLLTLLIISPILLYVLFMLAQSDAGFERLLGRLSALSTARFLEYLFKILLSILLSFPLFNLLYALKTRREPESHPLAGFLPKLRMISGVSTISALSAFCLIYTLYIALQANYLFSAIRGALPASFTYAEYARRGFFELVAVVFVNFCVIAFAVVFTKQQDGHLSAEKRISTERRLPAFCRIPATLLIACTLLLVVTAVSKMILYIGFYGLTPLRVYTSWFLLLLFGFTLFMLAKLLAPEMNFCRACAVFAVAFYLALNFASPDNLIARYNISQYKVTGKLDTATLAALSDSAVPEIAALKNDKKYGAEITAMLRARASAHRRMRWQNSSLSTLIAGRNLILIPNKL
jgi:hypothetical protein